MQIQSIVNTIPGTKQKGIQYQQYNKNQTQYDSIELNKSNIAQNDDNNSKVTFKEGVSLIGKGFINKVKDLGKAIITHPIKTIAIMAGTALGIAALPIIGISSVLGASVLAVGCAGIAVGKTVAHTTKAIKHNKNGEYNELRNDLEKIGGDTLDLALSLPFVPKALKTIKRNIKYAPAIGVNKDLLANIKNAKGIKSKYIELLKSNLRINYETMGNEMGLKVKPKLVFDDTMPYDLKKGFALAGEYEPTTAVMKINPKTLTATSRILTSTNPEAILRHELTHFQQMSDIARTEGIGINGLQDLLTRYYKQAIKIGNLPDQNMKCAENLINGDKSLFNSKFYESIIKEKGTIAAGTQEAKNVQTYMEGIMGKVTSDIDKLNNLNIGILGPSTKDMKEILKIYKQNPLETPAYNAQDLYTKTVLRLRPEISSNILQLGSITLDNEKKPS